MSISRLLSILAVVLFFVLIFITKKNKNRLYLQYVLLAYPLLNTYILPGVATMNGFNLITYIFFPIFWRQHKDIHLKNNGLIFSLMFGLLTLDLVVGVVISEGIGDDMIRDILDFFPIFFYAKILVDECLEDPTLFYNIVKWLKVTLVVALLFLCGQFVFGVKFSLTSVLNPNMTGGMQRYSGFFSDPQVFSQYLAAVSFVCLIKDPEDPVLPIKNYILLLLALVGIMYTGGRGGLGGWAVGFFVLTLFGNAKYRIAALVTIAVLGIVVLGFSDNFAIFQRGDDLADSYDGRYSIWLDAVRIFLDHPFFGIGMGNYSYHVSLHNPDQFWMVGYDVVYFDHPESGYLKILTELGAVGFILFLGFILIPLIKGFFLFLKKKDISLILLIAPVLSWMVAFYTVYSLGDIRMKIFIATMLCLILTSQKRLLHEDAEQTDQ